MNTAEISTNEIILIEFLSTAAEKTEFTFEALLKQFGTNKKLQDEFVKFAKLFKETMNKEFDDKVFA